MTAPLTAEEIAELREWVKLALGRSWTGDEAKLAFAFRHRIPRLLDELERSRELLKRIEWSGSDQLGSVLCPACGADQHVDKKHEPGCELAALIGPPSGVRQG